MSYYEYKQTRETEHTELLNKCGAIFAVGDEELEKSKKEGVKYYMVGFGIFIPQENYEMFMKEQDGKEEEFITKAKELFTPTEIIKYELGNYEYCVREDLTDTKETLKDFNFSDEEYRVATKEYMSNYNF